MSHNRISSRPFLRFYRLLAGFAGAFLLLLCPARATDAPPEAWKPAVTAYKAGDYQRARDAFLKIAEDEGQISAALCHNLGNCEYKLGQAAEGDSPTPAQTKEANLHYGPASIWYRRAVALDPFLVEAKQNLRWLESKLAFLTFKQTGLRDYASRLPKWLWSTAALSAVWVSGICIVWLVWVTPRRGRRWPLVTLLSVAAAVFTAAGLGLLGKSLNSAPFTKRLVSVESPNGTARVAPAEAANSVITLVAGSELIPIREEGFWTYCDIPGGDDDKPLRGWVRTKTTERLWPWNPSIVE